MLFATFSPHFSGPSSGVAVRQPYKIGIIESEYQHDVALLRISGEDWNGDKYTSGVPMTLKWGYEGGPIGIFNGYINHAKREYSTGFVNRSNREVPRMETKIVCVGSSWVMKQPKSQIFKRLTVPQMVASIANLFKLAADIENHKQVWPSISQHGVQSTWEFLVEQARKIGFAVFPRGVVIVCKSRQKIIDDAFSTGYVPVFSVRGVPSLATMESTLGQENPDIQYRVHRLHGVDASGQVIELIEDVNRDKSPGGFLGSVQYRPLFERNHANIPFADMGQGTAQLQGLALQDEFHHHNDVRVVGDPTVHQGSVVFFDDSFGNRESGYWYVHKAYHQLHLGQNFVSNEAMQDRTLSYYMDLHIGRDSSGISGVPPGQAVVSIPGSSGSGGRSGASGHTHGGRRQKRPSSSSIDQVRATTVQPDPPTVLVQDLWRSAYSQVRCPS